eukprot:NODE_9179_length_614_cov_75.028513_g8548_i0.p1 GENE.NODE_9179_length_614_cov_75.028513_g8548_i0~~NODE_9179_length_614_cov_75.028513_g8548_i0.p1  ORF type:complete len:135 (+),score=15.96 NODE_9179_length_614_cov_75.028513_g8548_i0:70-474(+)
MTTGVGVSDECIEKFTALKLRKAFRFITFVIQDKKEIVVEETGDTSVTYEDFKKKLPNEPRYYAIDFEFEKDGAPNSKIVFMLWNPDSAKVQLKMLYSASKDCIRKKLEGVVEYQANDLGDAEYASVLAKITRT